MAAWNSGPPVIVWVRFTAGMAPRDVAEARALLSPEEHARCDRFVFERDRRDFAAAHALLRAALTLHAGRPADSWRFESDAAGKPRLADAAGLEFSITHTRGLVACALSVAGAVGVDVEPVRDAHDVVEIAERHFADPEVRAIRACAPGVERQTRFTELWTLKEAYVKALGSGLRRPLDDFNFEFRGESQIHFGGRAGSGRMDWRFALLAPSPDYRLAVAVRATTSTQIRVRRWPHEEGDPDLLPLRASP